MIHAAHASRLHWDVIGLPVNRARGEWLCSRVYAVLGRGEPALWHARRCLEILEAGGEGIEDWDLPAAYEALARAHAVAGRRDEADAWRSRAREGLARVADAEDREPSKATWPACRSADPRAEPGRNSAHHLTRPVALS